MNAWPLEEQLKKSNGWLWQLFESNTIGFLFTNLTTQQCEYANTSFLTNLGYTVNDLAGKTVNELNLIDFTSSIPDFSQLLEKAMLGSTEISLKKKNGTLIWTVVAVQKIEIEKEFYYLTSFVDTTERKNTEERLARLAAIVEFSDDAIISKSLDGTIESWNRGAERMFGFTAKQALGQPIALIIPAEFMQEEEMILNRIRNNETVDHFETVRINNVGQNIQVSLTMSPLRNEEGHIIGISKIARDISEKAKASYVRNLIEVSLDPLVTISADGKITDVNEASVKVTGIDRERLIGTDFSDYFTEPEKARGAYEQVFEKGFVADYAVTIKHQSGTLTDVLYSASIYKDNKGKVLGVFAAARDITKQNQASQYARSLIEASLDPLVTISTSGKITDVNEAFVKVTGVKREQLINSNYSSYFTDPEKAEESYKLVFEKSYVSDYPLTIKHAKGKLTDVLYNASVYKDNEGRVLGVFAAARDVTEQKWAIDLRIANKELRFQNREKEKRADELIIANKALHVLNEGKEQQANELVNANKELAIQSEEKEKRANELIIANKELLFQSEEKEKRANELIIANKELLFQSEEKEKRANELIIANKELLFQSEEKEKRANELIIANKELLFQNDEKEKRAVELRIAIYARSLIEASLDPLFTISTNGKITDTNIASVNITGVSRIKLIGTNFADYFTDPHKASEVYQEVFDKGFVTSYPLTIKDHKLTDVLFNGSVYKDDLGNVIGAVVVARDITNQKLIANELLDAKISAELATEIAETAKNKAEHATQVAEEALKAKQQFLSNMSHEIRTPMNAIIGFTKVVLKTDLSIKQKEYVMAIKMSGDSLIVLINDILDLAKVDAGKMTFEKTPFKMAFSISSMLHLFEAKIQEKNLELITQYDNRIPTILIGDPMRLHQVILNLVSNAIKFTQDGTITVSTHLQQEDEESVNIEFAVSDTGIGIAESKIDSIFENFQQASSSTSRLFGGTGLGLAIVKQLVELQGGAVRVSSKLGEGSIFSFNLNFQKSMSDTEMEIEFEEQYLENKNIKVLVVEDIALNQLLMKTLLDDFGFDRDVAENGKIAIEMLQLKSYDVILMDLQMPEMNGFEATDYIRNTMNSKIPIIALTADVTTVDIEKCRSIGMNDYVAKPVDERLLYNKIINLVKKPLLIPQAIIPMKRNETNEVIKKIKCTNLTYLMNRTKSNPTLMMEMITAYLEQTPTLIKAMKQSSQNKDWSMLYAAVHKMIPSFLIMGMHVDVENMAKKVQEYASLQQQNVLIQDLVLKLEDICNQACEELTEELNTIKKNKK